MFSIKIIKEFIFDKIYIVQDKFLHYKILKYLNKEKSKYNELKLYDINLYFQPHLEFSKRFKLLINEVSNSYNNPYLFCKDIDIKHHTLIFGTTGSGMNSIKRTISEHKNKFIQDCQLDKFRTYNIYTQNNTNICVFYSGNTIAMHFSFFDYNYFCGFVINKNKLVNFSNNCNHILENSKINILTLLTLNPSFSTFKEVMNQNLSFSEKYLMAEMFEI